MLHVRADTAEWEHISMAEGAMPGPRASGACCVVDDDKILLFGGYDGVEFLDVRACALCMPPTAAAQGSPARASMHARAHALAGTTPAC
ncbi:hypothetical protein EON67_01945 [archaeon]|nr:MAG: hypothetical protein EON67_01945 [archaeon]